MPRDLGTLFAPHSVAVLGASNDPSKWGGDVAARLLNGPASRPVYFIDRKGGLVHGRHAYSSLGELPAAVGLVVLAVPAGGFEQAVDEALAAGAKALVVISAGLGEMGREGRMREQSVVARVRAAGAVMIGPHCPGIADTTSGLSGLCIVAATVNARSPAGYELHAGGIPVYREMTSAVDVVARLAGLTERDEWNLPELPPPQNPVADGDYWAAREALDEAGLTFPKAILACACEQAVAAAEEIGFPVAFKALGALHKTDAGDVELILGCRRDPRFGPLLVGFRGKLPLCVEAAARAAALLSAFAAAHPEVREVEANPLLVTRDRAMALDARIVLAPAAETAEWLESDP